VVHFTGGHVGGRTIDALTCSLAALLLATVPAPGHQLPVAVQDDALLLNRAPAQVQQYTDQIAQEGASYARLTASWSALAPSPRATKKPGTPFDAADSSTYPADGLRRLDTAVKAAAKSGLAVQMDLAFWAPRWAVPKESDRNDRERYLPRPAEFGLFARALARRYSGAFPDPDEKGKALPPVRLWVPWNEPNQPAFLMPQWRRDKRSGDLRPESPHAYRWLYQAAHDAIKDVNPGNQVLLGNTAPTAPDSDDPSPHSGVAPLKFLRTLGCLDDKLNPLNVPECKSFQPIAADGYAHHPYSRTSPPATSDPDPDDAPLANTDRLEAVLDQLAERGRIRTKLPLYFNEYGYETSPPDPTAGFSPDQQAQWMGQSTYLAYKDPRVRMFAQFGLRDIDPRETGARAGTKGYWANWQGGLFAADGQPKPAAQAFKLPFWAEVQPSPQDPKLQAVFLFGQVRGARGPELVHVERRDPGSSAWAPVSVTGQGCDQGTEFSTDASGAFTRLAPYNGAASYRMSARQADGSWAPSVEISVR
jgi:hypothetical protein